MKKILFLTFIFSLSLNLVSCKTDKKNEKTKEVKLENKALFSLSSAKNTIVFTAYKTTEKIPVKGQFKKINFTSGGNGNTIKEAINNTEFSIPVSSIFTKDSSRDFKIKKFFFGIMDNTELLSGKLTIENDSIGYANIKMNGVTNKVPFKYNINNKVFTISAVMDVTNWNGDKALTSLNEACKDLHKGSDGVSKTWSDVLINITSSF